MVIAMPTLFRGEAATVEREATETRARWANPVKRAAMGTVCAGAQTYRASKQTHARTGAVNTLAHAAQKVGSSNHPRLPVKIWSARSSIITADYATCSGSAVRTKTHAVGAWARILCQRTAPLFPRVGTPASCLPRPTHARVLGGVDVGSFDKVWPRSQP